MLEMEKDIEKAVVTWAKANGFLALKFTPKGDKGWPDRIFISPTGKHIWIEFKAPGKTPTKLQEKRICQLWNQGVDTYWFDDAIAAIDCLEGYMV